MNIIIGLLILSSIIAPIAIYKRSKSLKFRLIEHPFAGEKYYRAQVRIDGIWLYIIDNGLNTSTSVSSAKIDVQDTLLMIENFKKHGIFRIISNEKLGNNEKAINIEQPN